MAFALTAMMYFCPLPLSAASEMELSGFSAVQETGGGRWVIHARTAVFRDEKEVILDTVSAEMVSRGVNGVSVVGDKGRYDPEGLILNLEGNVVARTSEGLRLSAGMVRWSGPGAFLEARGGVELARRGLLVQGGSARYTIDTGTAFIVGKVVTILKPGVIGP